LVTKRDDEGGAFAIGKSISVIVVESNPVIRDVVRLACEASPQIRVVAEAGDGERVVDLCGQLLPDVLVLGVSAKGDMDGLERLSAAGRRPATIVVSPNDDEEILYRSRLLGVEAVLEQWGLGQNIATTIESVFRGQTLYSDDHDRKAMEGLASMIDRARMRHRVLTELTPRELEVLSLLAAGLSNKQCGRRLGISIRTVESHVSNLYRKLEARTRMEAVAVALMLGLVDRKPS
jgi:DNA-binding NarL/FixJ family response regulator